MASAFAHALVAYTATKISKLSTNKAILRRILIFAIIWAILPDIDTIGYFIGIPYQHILGHRGISHSILFAFICSFILVMTHFSNRHSEIKCIKQKTLLVIFFSIVMSSHGVLDALTTGGLGVAFFAPFDNSRYFFQWRPIAVSPLGLKVFFSEWGYRVIISELIWVALPCTLILLLQKIRMRRKIKESQ